MSELIVVGVDGSAEAAAALSNAVAQRMAKKAVDAFAADHPSLARRVEMEIVGVSGHPATKLVEQSRGADLLVVGHRGRGALAGEEQP